ncbi:uncharacterized protein LOC119596634 [Penaeus monodon]|uniref:uncharacterized protein LOC119596634 n=1 Tax=Penaeus monodon TaxID=6687 RepID=UPI0018A7A585|nr:uncharacterized protein LOC119596634 [Penaeus monodon]
MYGLSVLSLYSLYSVSHQHPEAFRSITKSIVTQLSLTFVLKLHAMSKVISLTECAYTHGSTKESTTSPSHLSCVTSFGVPKYQQKQSIKQRYNQECALAPKVQSQTNSYHNDMSLHDLNSHIKRGSGDGLTMELLTDQLVTNIMDEVTGRSVEVPEQQEPVVPTQKDSPQTGELAVEEGMALRLAFLQSASLRAICAIMNCTRYAEMLLVPKAAQEKDGGEKGSSVSLLHEEDEIRTAIRVLVRHLVSACTLAQPLKRQVSVAEVERSHLVLHSMCMRAWAEDSLSVADTHSRIMALTANEERATDQIVEATERPQSISLNFLRQEQM